MELLYTKQQVQTRIQELGKTISKDYQGKEVLLIGILKGASIFLGQIIVELEGDFEIDFMTISSYKHGSESSDFKLVQDLDVEVSGKHIIIVEDIVDTGKTVAFLDNYLKNKNVASVEIATLINKEERRLPNVKSPKYVGFEYNDPRFVIGYGYDFKEKYRNLPGIYMMDEEDKF